MTYPSLEQYNEALQYPKYALVDPNLKNGSISKTGLGLPLALCGGFALTYTLNISGKKYAIRCFHKESDNLQKRYFAISNRLRQLNSPYFVDFAYQPKGILINSKQYPIVQMAWADGLTMGEFIENNYKDRNKISSLRKALASMGSYLDQNKVAHGDLQPGNVMVSSGGTSVKLIDYDGMFVEEIRSLGSSELGHRNFQHPKRTSSIWDATLDRYSLIVLHLALSVLEVAPELWNKTQSDGDAFLFRANDFADPDHSKTFSLISQLPKLTEEVRNFAAVSRAKFQDIPTLEDFLQKKNIPQVVISISSSSTTEYLRQPYSSPFTVLDATQYNLCLGYIGDRIELIGQIKEVRNGKTRYSGKEYIFLNFGDWKGQILKVAIWSEGLEKLIVKPDSSWLEKWISVVGLLEPPYHNKQFNYTHLAISITQPNQMHIISNDEASYRLGKSNNKRTQINNPDNKNNQILEDIRKSREPVTLNLPPTQKPLTKNQAIFTDMKRQFGSQPTQQYQSSSTQKTTSPSSWNTPPSQSKKAKIDLSEFVGCLIPIVIVIIIIISLSN
ncbi:MAG TPA: serine/threonine protein kinase [Clostridiales bacterium]|jgi:serine/threonine protein kinase|nr:serine/threonine protein kinase [Clostridiales bacterium]